MGLDMVEDAVSESQTLLQRGYECMVMLVESVFPFFVATCPLQPVRDPLHEVQLLRVVLF